MQERIYVTEEGLEKLQERLRKATAVLQSTREEKSRAYALAGDGWHDNPYFNKLQLDEQRHVKEVLELQRLVAVAQVFAPAVRNVDVVRLGSIVAVSGGPDKHDVWEIVGYGETDLSARKLAYNSPIGEALLGRRKGECVTVSIDDKKVVYTVADLYPSWDSVDQ